MPTIHDTTTIPPDGAGRSLQSTTAPVQTAVRFVEDATPDGDTRISVVAADFAVARATRYVAFGAEYWIVLMCGNAERAALGQLWSRAFSVDTEDDARAALELVGRLYAKAVTR